MSVLNVNASVYYNLHCNHENGWSWAQQHDSTYATGGYGTDSVFGCSLYHGSGNSYDIYRKTAVFDTSSVPSNATISQVLFNYYRKKEHASELGYATCYLVPVSATGNAAGYYNKAYFGNYLTTLFLNGESDNVNTWLQAAIDGGAIVKGGATILGMMTWYDYNNQAPYGSGINQFNSDVSYPTYLTITYTTPPAVTSGAASSIGADSATLAGEVTDAGGGTVSERGVCWSLSANPTIADSKAASAGGVGAFTVNAASLGGSSVYHYRSYVTTENSTVYGADQTFTTLPVVTTAAMTNVGVGSAMANGQVTSAGEEITERGFVWGIATAPTILNNKAVVAGTTGVYNKLITALPVGRKVYLRAFATNATGTVYGSEVNFIMFGGAAIFSSL